MRAVRCGDAGVGVVDVPTPEVTADDVRVRVAAAGICGSDLHLVGWGALPVTLGHEIAGWLDDGTPVAVEPVRRCGACERCAAGDTHLCRSALTIGISVDGGMAEELVVGPECIVALPEGLAVHDAALVEPVACAIHALGRARVEGGMRVAVIGGGTLGVAAVAAAVDAGCTVGSVTRHVHQTAAVEALGAQPAEGHYDVVIEAAGTSSAFGEAAHLARTRGTIAILGTYWDELTVAAMPLSLKELDVVGCLAYGHPPRSEGPLGPRGGHREVEAAADLLARRPELVDALITHRFPLDEAPDAFRVAGDRAAGSIKVLLEP